VSTVPNASPETPDTGGSETAASSSRHHRFRLRSAGPRRHWIKHRWLRYTTIIVMVGALVGATLVLSEYAYVRHEFNQHKTITVQHLVKPVTTGPHANAETILLIGSTSRCALNGKQSQAFGSCSGPPSATTGITGVNSDVMLLLHTDPTTGKVSILSLPRDLVLYNVRDWNFHKLDAGLAEGPSVLVAAVEQDLGIPINHFVELNFDTFQNVVNTLGGVKVFFPERVYDRLSGLNIKAPGCHLLNGFQALSLVRARHMYYWQNGVENYDGSGDLGRIVRTHEFLRLLAAQVSQRGLGNIFTDNALVREVAPNLTLDQNFTFEDMTNLILNFHGTNPNKAPQTTMPNIEDHTDYMYEGYDYGSVVFPSYPQDQQAIDQFLELAAPPGSTVKPSSFTVRVLDGYNDPATAAGAASKLRALGYRVTSTGTWPAVGPISETVIEYAPGHMADAESLLSKFRGIMSMAAAPVKAVSGSDVPTSQGADVTVITGSNFAISSAHAPSTGHHQSGSGTGGGSLTSTPVAPTAPSSAESLLGPVSAAVDPTPPYDPRSCRN
jgi:LCP family protein required for cell wall assembly